MNKIRVFADFHNADVKGRVRLNCAGTITDLERQGIVLQDGQSLCIYSEELEVEGVVHYSKKEKLWTAVIDWNAIQEIEPVVSQLTIQDIIREIEEKSKGGGYIYRGERKLNEAPPYNGKVSSNLWREYGIEDEQFDIELVQKELLAAAKKHTGDLPQDFRLDVMAQPNVIMELTEEARNFEILTEIQHYGGKTNLIDFTTDYFIALFFACDGRYDEDGRIILQKTDEISGMIATPRNPRHRVIVQKSVFIRPPRGFIEPDENDIVNIPANLKEPLLQHLRDYHGISTEVIYNDLHGFIRNQNIHGDAYTHFYRGFACQNRANEASTRKERQRAYEEAIRHYTEAIKLKPYDASAYNNRGNAYVDKGEVDNAIRDFTETIKLTPDVAEIYHNRGRAYTVKNDCDNAIKDFTKAIQLKSDYAEAYSVRGVNYADNGEFEKAIKDYNKAIQLNPEFAGAYNNRAEVYKKKNDFHNAIKNYNRAIQIEPDYADAYNNRGSIYAQKGDIDSAIKDYNTAIELQPDDTTAYIGRGNVYADKGKLELAIKDYTEAIELQPDDAKIYNNRGVAYAKKGELERAIRDYNTAIKLNSNDAKAYNNRGSAYAKKGELEKAIRDHTKAIRLQTNDAGAYYNRGVVYAEKGDLDNAISDYTEAIKLNPDDAKVYYNRGTAYVHKGEFEKAISDYNTAIKLNPDDAKAYSNRGVARLELRKWEEAKSDLTSARNMGVDIIAVFHNDYESVADFEQKTGVQLPANIAALLTPS